MADEQTFGSISLFAGGISSQGALRLGADKVEWKKAGGGRSVSIAKGDVGEVTYSQIPGGVSLTVRSKGSAPAMRMKGFRGSDITAVKEAMKSTYGADCTKRDTQSIGRNWGQVAVDQAGAITFDVENKRAFEISAKDVSFWHISSPDEYYPSSKESYILSIQVSHPLISPPRVSHIGISLPQIDTKTSSISSILR